MSEKDTVKEQPQKNNHQKELGAKTSILLFNFSNLKKNNRLIISDYNLFNYNFETKEFFELNPKKESFKKKESGYINKNLNLMNNKNIDMPSSEKLFQEKFCKDFIENYDTSFANFCQIDKNQFIKAFVHKKYIPQLDKFGDIKISVNNLLDILKNYSQFLKLKIKRRFIKKYKKKKLFKTMKSDELNLLNNLNKDGLKLISLKKNLKISVKKHNNNNNSNNKENIQEGNINYNSNNNLLNNINNILNNDYIFSNNIKSSIFNLQPLSNNYIPNADNFFTFSNNDQNFFDFNNINLLNQAQLGNNQNNQFLNKKRTFTPYIPFTPYYNSNPNLNQINKKNNQVNINLPTPLFNYNSLISPQILDSYKGFLTPSSIHFSQGGISSPFINIPNDRFNFSNIRNPLLFGSLNNQSPIINNNININQNYININNNNIKENNIII